VANSISDQIHQLGVYVQHELKPHPQKHVALQRLRTDSEND